MKGILKLVEAENALSSFRKKTRVMTIHMTPWFNMLLVVIMN